MHDHARRRSPRALRWLLPLLILVLVPLSAAAQGAAVWQVQVGTLAYDGAEEVAVDSAGNVYLVGITDGDFGGQTRTGRSDAFVSKYTASGAPLWTRLVGGAGAITYGLGVAVDADDHVYLVGTTNASLDGQTHAGLNDAYLRKYDRDGTAQWTRLIGTAEPETGQDVAVDGAGRVYVTGATRGSLPGQTSAGDFDIFVSVYDGSGAQQWTRQIGSPRFDLAYGVAVDGTNSAYLAGYVEGTIGGQPTVGERDGVLIKFGSSGAQQWTRLTGYAGYDAGTSVAVNAAGTSYLVGPVSGIAPGQPTTNVSDGFVRAYDASGALQWSRQFGTPELEWPGDAALDSAGDLYVAGYTQGPLSGQPVVGIADLFVRKYSPNGSVRWTLTPGTNQFDAAQAVAVSVTDALYLAGSTTSADNTDALLIRSINPTLTPRTFLPLVP